MPEIDHLVFAAPTLAAGIAAIEERLGARTAPGGRHPEWGTHNALLALGEAVYLEIVAPEPGATPAARFVDFARPGLPRLVTWAARTANLERAVERARAAGLDLGEVRAGGRRRADGASLRWRLTDPAASRLEGVVPFLIDWGETPHPATSAPRGGHLVALEARHPDAPRVRHLLETLGLEMPVAAGPAPQLVATIATARGLVDLR